MSSVDETDYEKKYQEDLEKAQALSLESLALEMFRLEKERTSKAHRNESYKQTTSSLDHCYLQKNSNLKIFCGTERPRPGTVDTKGSNLLLPPPQCRRDNTPSNSSEVCRSSEDLISFQSPTNSKSDVKSSSSDSDQDSRQNPCLASSEAGAQGSSNLFCQTSHYSTVASSSSCLQHQQTRVYQSTLLHSNSTLIPDNVHHHENFENFQAINKAYGGNLIDFSAKNFDSSNIRDKNVRVSLLEAFDPLIINTSSDKEEMRVLDDSIYEPYDPFHFLYSELSTGPILTSPREESLPHYSTVVKTSASSSAPPLPPRNSIHHYATIKKAGSRKYSERLYENVKPVKRTLVQDADLIAFHNLVKSVREKFDWTDTLTNMGIVISPTIENFYGIKTSVKVIVHCSSINVNHPVTFTCDVNASVEHVLMHVTCEVDSGSIDNYILKVYGLAEYLETNSCLADYEYVHTCIKLEKDIELSLTHVSSLQRTFLRTAGDDKHDKEILLEDLLPKEPAQPIPHESLIILLVYFHLFPETLEAEIDRIICASKGLEEGCGTLSSTSCPPLQSRSVAQAVKAICALLGNVETIQMTHALENFIHACEESPSPQWKSRSKPEIIDESGNYSVVTFREESISEVLNHHCDQIRIAVQGLITIYSKFFKADFQLVNFLQSSSNLMSSSEITESLLINIGCIHRLSSKWNCLNYFVEAQVYHGTRPLGVKIVSQPVEMSKHLYQRIVFDSWLSFEGTLVSDLPRESRVVISIYGQLLIEETLRQMELGWTAIQLFDYNRRLTQGTFLLPIWEGERNKRLGPAPAIGTHPFGHSDPVIGIELQDYGGDVFFPEIILPSSPSEDIYDFTSLDYNTQQQLLDIINQDTFSNPVVEDREVLWEKRHYLRVHPTALPKVLLAAHSWDYSCLHDLHSMLHSWAPLDPVSALQLLLPCFADNEVRKFAVRCINKLKSDELIDYLPQIVQALKYENYEASSLSKLLLERSLDSPRVAHSFYWLLVQELPGETPQNTCDGSANRSFVTESRYYKRLQLMLRALLAVSGEALRKSFMSQQLLIKGMTEIAENVKGCKEATRLNSLMEGLHNVNSWLVLNPCCLPLSPSLHVSGIHVRSSSYFPSNTLPLKINFTNDEGAVIPAIFKVGDDLKQDMLTLQMIRIMNKLWLKEGLDLKMVTFSCVPTGYKKGIIEMVPEAETLRKIQVEFGVTGSFKEWPIAEWLAKHNPSALDYERAVANFTASCAGYCVATYVLGICDRHNDNIMLKTSGHLFHIDFGKFLGDAQMFGNFKRDRTPFVLTSDMAFVINGGDKPSARFHNFVDLCCNAFNIVRKQGNLILNLFGLMASSGAAGLTADSVRYVQNALLPELSNPEAAATFARMIQSSLKSWFTQINFFLHNIAQLKFTGDHNDGTLLSFVPRTFSMHQEGRLKSVDVYGYQKRYDPEKYYVYILKVERISYPDPSFLFRSYKEFCEFQQKLCLLFPLAKCYSLQGTSIHMGRSNIKQVAEKRMRDIKHFLSSLFVMADEICHSDLVYTFFHPLLRDQQESSIHSHKLKDQKKDRSSSNVSKYIKGHIKLTLHYQRETLWVMVHHVKELPYVAGGQEPSTYVKVYLLPDPTKATKRKTKVVRKNAHPSFMEMLEYRMPLEIVQQRFLQATVWNHDTLQENEFLGGTTIKLTEIDLCQETTNWYSLGNVSKGIGY